MGGKEIVLRMLSTFVNTLMGREKFLDIVMLDSSVKFSWCFSVFINGVEKEVKIGLEDVGMKISKR